MMKMCKTLQEFIEHKIKYCYVAIVLFFILETVNNAVMTLFIPPWGVQVITLVLLLVLTGYITVVCKYVYKKIKESVEEKQAAVTQQFEDVHAYVKEISEQQTQLQNQLAEQLQGKLERCFAEMQEETVKQNQEVKSEIADFRSAIIELFNQQKESIATQYDSLTEQLATISSKYDEQLQKTEDKLLEKVENDRKVLEELAEKNKQAADNQFMQQSRQIEDMQSAVEEKLSAVEHQTAEQKEALELQIEEFKETVTGEFTKQKEREDKRKEETEEQIKAVKVQISDMAIENTDSLHRIKTELMEKAEKDRKVTEKLNKEYKQSVSNQFTEQSKQIKEVRNVFENKIESLFSKIEGIQQQTEKIIGQTVSEQLADNTAKLQSSYDRIYNQIFTVTEKLQNVVNETKKQEEKLEQSGEIQKETIARLENLERQLLNLNSIVDFGRRTTTSQQSEQQKSRPDRVERIAFDDSDSVMLQHYKNDKLVLNEIVKGNKKTYDAQYDTRGVMVRDHNYDEKEAVILEHTYYPNGQVKERIENVKVDGKAKKIITKYDQNGKKIQ